MKSLLALVVLALFPLAASAQVASPLYCLTEIGDFPGGADQREAWDVNDLGLVVGAACEFRFTGMCRRGAYHRLARAW